MRRAYELAKIGATEPDALDRQRVNQDIFREGLVIYCRELAQ